MKILALHVDWIKFKPLKKALKSIEELPEDRKKEKEVKEALVILTAVEKQDESNLSGSVKLLVENIKDIADKVKADTIVLYPYAHLSPNLSSPSSAVKVLDDAAAELKKQKFKVEQAPFGYYKEFSLKCKGHPLSELSRSFGGGAEKQEGKEEPKSLVKDEIYDYKKLLHEISKNKLDREKLAENDHRIIGRNLDLFSFSEVAPGMVFWHNNGLIIYNELINFWREEHRKAGYKEISTPFILDKKLWQISGHWEKYKENIFLTKYEGREFAVKPMNCPGGMLVYKNSPKSYKELPLRVGEMGVVHRQELSGVLAGLFRVIKITQDDAHIFCANEKQVEEEIIGVIRLINKFYDKLKIKFDHIELSTRPEKRIGSDETWDMAESILERVLKKLKIKYQVNKGDGAFYGPKIDFHIKDSLGRTWQLSTIQLDFAMPERFELEYTDKDNTSKRPIMLHRVIYGALERFIGILIEHTNGHFPTWLAPVQAKIITLSDDNLKYAQKVEKMIREAGIRVEADYRPETVQSRIRDAAMKEKVPYILVVGEKEEKAGTVAVRTKDGKVKYGVKIADFIENICKEIKERR
jgi:threonyl-tRNA synthetase